MFPLGWLCTAIYNIVHALMASGTRHRRCWNLSLLKTTVFPLKAVDIEQSE